MERSAALLVWGLLAAAAAEKSPFLDDVVLLYGDRGFLTPGDFRDLVDSLVIKNPPDLGKIRSNQCLSGAEILSQYGLGNLSRLDGGHLSTVCPALLHHAVVPQCLVTADATGRAISFQVWGYGFLAVTLINLSSLLGLMLIPITRKPYFPKVLTYFIGLAIGTLFSNAVLQLIPEALGFDPKSDNYILKAIGVFGGFYLLFFVEKVLKMILKPDVEHCHSHFSPSEAPPPMAHHNGSAGEKVEIVTVTSFSSDSVNFAAGPLTRQPDTSEARRPCCRLPGARLSTIKTVAWMISLSDALHNFIDGLAIGASFTVSVLAGFSTSLAIVCEEFPHELGDFVILLNAGMSVPQAVFFNLLSAMSCYLGLVIGILLGSHSAPNVIFAIAGGMFLYIALADMFPEMNSIAAEQRKSRRSEVAFFLIQNAGLLTGFSIILLITLFAGDIDLG
ncbi:zinc transporter ZIP8 [Denticeps clupeoides]|uniref:Solute carrier family 39 member 8 n=1 Tax=Denticeps clupeoides TaxID=299321 RepID=A0AAY4DXE9_9TELE|nr:zinc transporter ZIP8 [Denticeps clupeoides]